MGIIRDILLRPNEANAAARARIGISSPWSDQSSLSTIVWAEALGVDVDALPLDRDAAITIPAVSKARNLLVSTVAKFPLVAARYDRATGTDVDTTTEHPWLWRTNGIVSPYERMAWTVDDAIFHGCSLWLTERSGSADASGRRAIADASYVPWDWWSIESGRFVYRDGGEGKGEVLNPDDYLFINFPFEGLLNVGVRTLRGAMDTERSWVGKVRSPIPLVDLHRTEDVEMDDVEVQAMVDAWATARTSPNGAIGSTPAGIELNVHGAVDPALMIEGRNVIRTDVGSFLNVRASMLDGTAGIDSLTYSTTEGERNSFYEFDLPFWTDPIEARFSQDDVMPRGQRTRFEKYNAYPVPTGPRVED